RARQPAAGDRGRVAAGAPALRRQGPAGRTGAPAAGAAARRGRLRAAGGLRGAGPVGAFLEEHLGLRLAFRWTGAALASAIMGFPLMVRAIRLSLEAVDRRLEQAAATLGAAPW